MTLQTVKNIDILEGDSDRETFSFSKFIGSTWRFEALTNSLTVNKLSSEYGKSKMASSESISKSLMINYIQTVY